MLTSNIFNFNFRGNSNSQCILKASTFRASVSVMFSAYTIGNWIVINVGLSIIQLGP